MLSTRVGWDSPDAHDWMIKYYLPTQLSFIGKWLNLVDSRPELNIQISKYSDLKLIGHDGLAAKLISALELENNDSTITTKPRRVNQKGSRILYQNMSREDSSNRNIFLSGNIHNAAIF